ncbi:GGDEF domain-containing protein [Photobacterium damselae subsp. damselae]|uniref:GGDEF domain-containing protein n=1 Tax=Photobacterium damselae TaxID=38293 RepID=UPI00311B0137
MFSLSMLRSASIRLLIPLLIAGLLIFTYPQLYALLTPFQASLQVLPFVVLALVIILSQPFNQGRIGIIAILMLESYFLILNCLQQPLANGNTRLIYILLSALLPLNLLLLHIVPEKRLLSRCGFAMLIFNMVQIALSIAIVWLYDGSALSDWWYAVFYSYNNISPLPIILLLLNIALICSSASAILKRNQRTDQAIYICLLFSFITLAWFDNPFISSMSYSCAAILLLSSLITSTHELVYIDPLTTIPGRRALDTELKYLGRTYTLAMMDVDNFKDFNDLYGHETGDEVLRLVAQISQKISGVGKVFRYGGEEFTLLFKGKNINEVQSQLEYVREEIACYDLVLRDHDNRPLSALQGRLKRQHNDLEPNAVHITVSIGVADSYSAPTPNDVLNLADIALYNAKDDGRNQVSVDHTLRKTKKKKRTPKKKKATK